MKEKKRIPFFRSLQFKYAMSFISIIALVLVLLNSYPVLASQDLVFRSKQTALKNRTSVIASALSDLKALSPERVEQVVSVLDSTGLARVLITDQNGRIVFDLVNREGTLPAHLPEKSGDGQEEGYRYALIREVVLALKGWDVVYPHFEDGKFLSVAAVPIRYRNMTIGAVCVCEIDADQGSLLLNMQSMLRGISAVVAVAALLLGVLFSRMFTSRIGALLRAIRVVGAGEYGHRIQPKGNDELTRLAEEFNQLTDRLETTEEVRRRFVSDASHELKTPLASIRLLSDSILQSKNMDPETTQEFVGDIGNEAGRLTRITEKLLTLTRLDSLPPDREGSVDAGLVVRKVLHMLSPVAEQAQVELKAELEEDCLLRCSGDDLYQICFNLVENGIKYNRSGGSVTVRLYSKEHRVLLEVEDTGVGIPEEHQEKIFDRFYRVDKARSRAAGGTGLGLSIVRDMVRRHGGTVMLRSAAGQGSKFTISFVCVNREGGDEE